MPQLEFLAAWFAAGYRAVARRITHDDRGDVPGWVMVTVMTAGLVVVIFAVFRDRITEAISDAIDSVTNSTSK